MCKIISIINNKGGVGKTTSTGIISELLSYLNQKVLMVDLDQQSNLSMLFEVYEEDTTDVLNGLSPAPTPNITELFKYRYRDFEHVSGTVRKTAIANLDIIPSSKRHKHTPTDIIKDPGNNNIILKRALNTLKDYYDFILIDNAPANDILTVNSMFVSDMIIVPVRTEGFSYKGLKETIDTILYIKNEHDINTIEFAGAFITQAEIKTNSYKSIRENYQKELGAKFLNTPIRKDIKISEIETNFNSILKYAPDTNVVFDYSKLILELDILDTNAAHLLSKSIGIA